MTSWKDPAVALPEEKEEVWIEASGSVRPRYYRIGDRWYALEDLDRWRMNTSRYWKHDRSWYLKTEQVGRWRPAAD